MRRVLPPGHPEIATGLNNLAFMLAEKGDLDEARAHYETVLAMQRRVGAPAPFVAVSLRSLATVHLRAGRGADAAGMLEEAVEIERGRVGEGHPDTARTRVLLGWSKGLRGDWHGAETMQRDALAVLEAAYPPDHPRVAETRVIRATSLVALGRIGEAGEQLRVALAVLERSAPPTSFRIRMARELLAEVEADGP